jgi:hypothetical protein
VFGVREAERKQVRERRQGMAETLLGFWIHRERERQSLDFNWSDSDGFQEKGTPFPSVLFDFFHSSIFNLRALIAVLQQHNTSTTLPSYVS